jgi:hypothetical protein
MLNSFLLGSVNDLLLNEGVLVQHGHVLSTVELVPSSLCYGHNQTLAEAATHQYCQDAEVENHGSLGV